MGKVPNKFKAGSLFSDANQLEQWIKETDFVWWGERPMHVSFLIGMPYRVVEYARECGLLKKAIPSHHNNNSDEGDKDA